MAKPIKTLFKDAVEKNVPMGSDHKGSKFLDSDLTGIDQVIGVSISGEPNDMFEYIDSLD